MTGESSLPAWLSIGLSVLLCAATAHAAPVGTFSTTSGFGLLPGDEGFEARATGEGDVPMRLAGSHPRSLDFEIAFNEAGEFEGQPGDRFSDGDLRDLRIDLPLGMIANPAALQKCTAEQFNTPRSSPFEDSASGEDCPDDTQVGVVTVHGSHRGATERRFGLFNLVPAPGVPAQLGFSPYGTPVIFNSQIRNTEAGYRQTLEIVNFPQAVDVLGLDVTIWGVPWGVGHNGQRGDCLNELEPTFPWAKCSVGAPSQRPPLAFLTMPVTCAGPLSFTLAASAWHGAGAVSRTHVSRDEEGDPVELEGCAEMDFTPRAVGVLTNTKASSASGFSFELLGDEEAGLTDPLGRNLSPARRAVVRLPEGATLNPSLAAGLGVCHPDQYARETPLSPQGAACPNSSKIGDFTVHTPLFEETIDGAVYLAAPDDRTTPSAGAENPFDSLLAIYLVAKAPQRGVLIKVAGKIEPDPRSGQLTATFDLLPQLPYSELRLRLREGQRAPLVTPPSCGSHPTHVDLTPWSDQSVRRTLTIASVIDAGAGGSSCPVPGTRLFQPRATAGGVNSNVGSYTPYYVRLSRTDADQQITSYSMVLPKGITGKLAGIPFCPDSAIEAARVRTGFAETAAASCPKASEVGHTLSGYGIGAVLAYAPGRIYLAGPYKGSPLSLVSINAATVGPFDLGTIVIRSAFDIDPRTAQLSIDSSVSDPIPHILHGIPLHLRDIRVYMDRPQFTRNPTSCEPSRLDSTLTGSGERLGDPGDDSAVTLGVHFQLLNCLTLRFRPRLGVRLRGSFRRGGHPSLRAVYRGRPSGDSNLKKIAVTIPRSLFLAQSHIRGVCSKPAFAAERCPPGSAYGRVRAVTPLFDEPLRGNVYLRSSDGRLPDLVASLRSGAIRIVVEGNIGPARHGLRATFEELPDAPITTFVLTMFGGKRGLLENSTNICAAPPRATVKALAQNNLGAIFETRFRGKCGGRGNGK